MHRHHRVERWVFVMFALTVAAVAISRAPTATALPKRPDIIVILTDDERYGTLRWMPHVWNDIVTQGTRFSNAMVPTSLCCPSRASLLTGRFAHGTKVWTNTNGWQTFKAAGNEARTVAVWLSRAGYRTGLVGKYLNGFAGSHPPPGWTRWHSFVGGNGSYYDYQILNTNGSLTSFGHARSDYSTNVLRKYAVSYLRSSPTRRPTFLYFAPFAPHGPATPAPERRQPADGSRAVLSSGLQRGRCQRQAVVDPSAADGVHFDRRGLPGEPVPLPAGRGPRGAEDRERAEGQGPVAQHALHRDVGQR